MAVQARPADQRRKRRSCSIASPSLVDELRIGTDKLAKALDQHASSAREAREVRPRHVVPAMAALRETGDHIELLMPHETWPLPTYREMLFIK